MYRYETHLHTSPVSKCASASVRETLEFYKSLGYDGVFITNHFLDGNINIDRSESYEKKINFYFSDYEEGIKIGKEIGIKVFSGIESSYKGTDFLIYGLDKKWYLDNPHIMDMKKRDELDFISKNGGYIVHAHPFREDSWIDHIRLFPKNVHAVEINNAGRPEFQNKMAEIYAKEYGLMISAGSDNHIAGRQKHLAGVEFDTPLKDEYDFIERIKSGNASIFTMDV